MKSNVNIARHPVHPFLVLLPVGAWVAALVFDLVYLGTRNPFWHTAAYWNILFGVIAAFIAAIAGMTDLFTLPMWNQARSIGWTHMILNITITTLFIINLVVRAQTDGALAGGPLVWSTILTIVAIGMLLVSGWLGGELVYRWGVAVPEQTIERIPPVIRPAPGRMRVAGARGGEREGESEEQS